MHSERYVRMLECEGPNHECASKLVIAWTRTWMQDPRWRETLRAAGYPLEEEWR